MMRRNLYADKRAPDGGLSDGWRRVKKGGWVKFAGTRFYASELEEIPGELVRVSMGEYWESYVSIHMGRIGCMGGFLCHAHPKNQKGKDE